MAENRFPLIFSWPWQKKKYCFRVWIRIKMLANACLSLGPPFLKKWGCYHLQVWPKNFTLSMYKADIIHIQHIYIKIGVLLEKSKKASWGRVIMSFEKHWISNLSVTCISFRYHHYAISCGIFNIWSFHKKSLGQRS